MPIRDLETWNAENFRLTVFPVIGQDINTQGVFEEVAELSPEETISKHGSGHTLIRAGIEYGELQLIFEPDRIHWVHSTKVDKPPDEPRIPILGPYPNTLESFRPIAAKWFKNASFPEITRLAFGTVLLSPVENRPSGYELLVQYVPSLEVDPHNVSDLLYQINRRRISEEGSSGLKVNRMTKWSVVMSQFTGLQILPSEIRKVTEAQTFALRLELDINTDQAYESILPRDSIQVIFDELVELATEIALEGDVI